MDHENGNGVSDPIKNCLLEVCCGPEPAQAALAGVFADYGVPEKHAAECAEVVFKYFDLWPRGLTMVEAKAEIARLARQS